jgi:hypothetical protein
MANGETTSGDRARMRGAITVIAACGLALMVVGLLAVRAASPRAPVNYGVHLSIADLTAGGPSGRVEAGRLVMTLRISSGPYFLSELVAAEISLANDSQTTYTLQGFPHANDCAQALWADLSGGGAPTYTLPTAGFVSCPDSASELSPGQTWTVDEPFPFTASGSITLTAQARFLGATAAPDGTQYETPRSGPFADQWPTIPISIASSIPPDRVITLHSSGFLWTRMVTIDAPQPARSSLYAIYVVACDGQGRTEQPNLTWQPIESNMLTDPGCSGINEVWKYSVGAPGYAIASGNG